MTKTKVKSTTCSILLIYSSFHQFSLPTWSRTGSQGSGASLGSHWVKGRVHHGHDAIPSQTTINQKYFNPQGNLRILNRIYSKCINKKTNFKAWENLQDIKWSGSCIDGFYKSAEFYLNLKQQENIDVLRKQIHTISV